MRLSEAKPLPGASGANATILRRLIALAGGLVKTEIETFARYLLPPLLDASEAAVTKLISIMAKSDEPTLRAKQLSTLANGLDDIFAEAGSQMSEAFGKQLPKIVTNYADATHEAIVKSVPQVGSEIFSPLNLEEVENYATRFSSGFDQWTKTKWEPFVVEKSKKAIASSLALGHDAAEAARQLSNATGIGIEAARANSRTVIHANAADLREQYFEENSDAFTEKEFVATLDTRTCPVCGGFDGRTWKLDDKGAPSIPVHRNCRCVFVPVVGDWESIGLDGSLLEPATRASLDGEVPASMNYSAWLAAQQESEGDEFLRSWLGRRRFERWQRGVRDGLRFATEAHRWQYEADRSALRKWKLGKSRID